MTALRFGIVGAGMMAREHIRNLKLVDDVRVAALADPVQSSLDASIAEIGHETPTFADAAAMMSGATLDAVIVCSHICLGNTNCSSGCTSAFSDHITPPVALARAHFASFEQSLSGC